MAPPSAGHRHHPHLHVGVRVYLFDKDARGVRDQLLSLAC